MSPRFVLRNVLRNKRRSALTLLGVAAAIFVYAALQSAVDGILLPARQASEGRLLNVREERRANVLASRLPESLEPALASVPGVQATSGVFTVLAVVGEKRTHIFIHGGAPEPYRALKRLQLPEADWARFREDRAGMIAGHVLAEQMGWRVGQEIELRELGMRFRVDAILPPQEPWSDLERQTVVHRDYLQASRGSEGRVTVFLVQPKDGVNELDLARAIDDRTSTSESPTETASEAAYAQKIVDQFMGFVDYLKVMGAITIAITFLGALNAVSMSVRERVREIGLLRTLGYRPGTVLALIVAESSALAIGGGLLGLAIARGALGGRGAVLAGLTLEPRTLAVGLGASVAVGVLGGLLPGAAAVRMKIVETLRVVD